MSQSSFAIFLIIVPLLLVSVSVHEFAHGWVAYLLGDTTAKDSGRLTLNPFAHVDRMGMVVVPILLALTIGIPFGWAKPVPVNAMNLRNPKRDMIWVALAGPVSNIILAFLGVMIIKAGLFSGESLLSIALMFFVIMNLSLACLNVLPIPPLDGSRVLSALLPRRQAITYARLEPYGFLIVLALLYFGFVGTWIRAGMGFFLNLFGLY
jgi:Zn-dependent protease